MKIVQLDLFSFFISLKGFKSLAQSNQLHRLVIDLYYEKLKPPSYKNSTWYQPIPPAVKENTKEE